MAAPSLPTSLFLGSPATRKTSLKLSPAIKIKPTKPTFAIRCSSKDDHSYGEGRLVDENMAVLRMRIHELEGNYETQDEWLEPNWEKECRTGGYGTITCAAVGILQDLLLYAKPSLTAVFMVLLAIGVPASLFLLVTNFVV